MRTIKVNLYTLDELETAVRTLAIEGMRDINTQDQWWNSMYEDAQSVGLTLTTFDISRSYSARGYFTESAQDCMEKITAQHGEQTKTYDIALEYLKEIRRIERINARIKNKEFPDMADYQAAMDQAGDDFLYELLVEYATLLQKELEYLQSDEGVADTILANEYEFMANGVRFI